MKKFIKDFTDNIKTFSLRTINALTPAKETITGGGLGIIIVAALTLIIPLSGMIKYAGIHVVITTIVAVLLAAVLTAQLANLILQLAIKIPLVLRLAIFGAIPVVLISFGTNTQTFIFMFFLLSILSFMAGAGVWLLHRWKWREISLKNRVLTLMALIAGFGGLAGGTAWLLHPGKDTEPPLNSSYLVESLPDKLEVPDPSSAGNYSIEYLTYGSGEDKHRKEYGEDAMIITHPVNGSAFLSAWKGIAGKLRTWYFGFDRYNLPVNAKVWYPEGKGQFPLLLAVHGNHLAQDWSEGGYSYLGKLLASRGYIFVSVDQNFLNGSYTNIFNGLSNENDARAWLLLKHLQQWRKWNSDSLSPFFNMVDMDNIALAGHSRGGEAVGHAALFNTLPHYPDDARKLFDFNFNIRAIIAIAPSDRQYEPAGTGTPLKDISYFVLHGSHDADVQSFLGMRQYNRLSFSPGFNGFKSALYIYRANHGQFNTSWGKKDFQPPRINLFNLKQLLPEEEQQQIAMVYISAFLEATLKKRADYRPLFMDHRKGREWLPETIYLNQYEDPRMLIISDFNEDLDLTTTSMERGCIETKNLTLWREETAKIKWGEQETRSAIVGWNNSENDCIPASYTFMLPEGIPGNPDCRMLFITLADSDESPDPESLDFKPINNKVESNNEPENTDKKTNILLSDQRDNEVCSNEELKGIDFTIELTDESDRIISFPLGRCSLLQPRLEKQMAKMDFMRTAPKSETVFSFFYFNLDDIAGKDSEFNSENIKKLSLVFDRTESGVIIINNAGLMPAFEKTGHNLSLTEH